MSKEMPYFHILSATKSSGIKESFSFMPCFSSSILAPTHFPQFLQIPLHLLFSIPIYFPLTLHILQFILLPRPVSHCSPGNKVSDLSNKYMPAQVCIGDIIPLSLHSTSIPAASESWNIFFTSFGFMP